MVSLGKDFLRLKVAPNLGFNYPETVPGVLILTGAIIGVSFGNSFRNTFCHANFVVLFFGGGFHPGVNFPGFIARNCQGATVLYRGDVWHLPSGFWGATTLLGGGPSQLVFPGLLL